MGPIILGVLRSSGMAGSRGSGLVSAHVLCLSALPLSVFVSTWPSPCGGNTSIS